MTDQQDLRALASTIHQALNDLCCDYAHDFCDEVDVIAARDRISHHGGVLGYITDALEASGKLQEHFREAAAQLGRVESNVPTREDCFDLWMATDEDHSSLGEHIHRFAKRLLTTSWRPADVPDSRPIHSSKVYDDEPKFDLADGEIPREVYFFRVGWNAYRSALLSATPQPDSKEPR